MDGGLSQLKVSLISMQCAQSAPLSLARALRTARSPRCAPTLHRRMRDERRAGRRTLSAGHRRVQVRCHHRVSAAPLSRASTARSCSCDCLSHGFPLRHVRRRETAELSDMQLGERSPQGTAACRCAALVTPPRALRVGRVKVRRRHAASRGVPHAECHDHAPFASNPLTPF